jgi:hypothetical protein
MTGWGVGNKIEIGDEPTIFTNVGSEFGTFRQSDFTDLPEPSNIFWRALTFKGWRPGRSAPGSGAGPTSIALTAFSTAWRLSI